MRRAAYAVVAALLLAGCAADPPAAEPVAEQSTSPPPTEQSTSPPVVEQPEATSRVPARDERVYRRKRGRSVETTPPPRRGIDVSHHQGGIDWQAVAGDDIDFAYLKATEGSSFTDDRFVANARAARAAGIKVGGYHYYTLCAAPEPQADHFVAMLEQVRIDLPPVVDLELIGNCDPPPDRATLQADVETFIDAVEKATDKRVVVYFHPDFEQHYTMVDDLDRRLWVRRVGTRPPPGDWFIWQRNDAGTVAGIGTPVDIDVMRVK